MLAEVTDSQSKVNESEESHKRTRAVPPSLL